ncbi:MAG TPA: hypothetical protein VKU77_17205 [Streptosporangiaceae bacterium]|nr:hypothetical protein [Streptosporangiaceae bacterium]
MTNLGEERPSLGAVLTELTSARVPWLALARDLRVIDGAGVTLIDLADPHAPPVTVNPFEPEPGHRVQAHATRLAGLFEAAFGLPGPVATAVRAGLHRAYADCGWDALTGTAPPGARTVPAIPAFAQLARATLAAAADLGYDRRMRAAVRGLIQARLEPLWTGPAGRFLEGGHPADAGGLIRGQMLVRLGDVADDDGLCFLAGALLARITDRLRLADPRLAVVTSAGLLPNGTASPRAAQWFARQLADLRSAGAQVTEAPEAPGPPHAASRSAHAVSGPAHAVSTAHEASGPGNEAGSGPASETGAGLLAVLRGRRSAACGVRCRTGQPCAGYELHAADLLAREDEQAWVRLWAQTLLLAFLAGRPLPRVPAEVLSRWRALSPPRRECVLATILDRAVTARAAALRPSYDPAGLAAVLAAVAGRMLDQAAVPFRAGPAWVIPQLRWLHELERLNPLGGAGITLDDIAPPLDFGLAGLPDWPGIRIRDRLGALGRHRLSMASPRNRRLARLALLGEDEREGLDADLAAAALGIHPAARLAHAARLLGTGGRGPGPGGPGPGGPGPGGPGPGGPGPGWLEVVLSWPDRFIRPSWDTDTGLLPTATG